MTKDNSDGLMSVHPDLSDFLGGLGKTRTYELLHSGAFETVLIGKRRMVTRRSAEAYVDRLVQEQLGDPETRARADAARSDRARAAVRARKSRRAGAVTQAKTID